VRCHVAPSRSSSSRLDVQAVKARGIAIGSEAKSLAWAIHRASGVRKTRRGAREAQTTTVSVRAIHPCTSRLNRKIPNDAPQLLLRVDFGYHQRQTDNNRIRLVQASVECRLRAIELRFVKRSGVSSQLVSKTKSALFFSNSRQLLVEDFDEHGRGLVRTLMELTVGKLCEIRPENGPCKYWRTDLVLYMLYLFNPCPC
jgi:hypothetical protein